MNIIEIADPVCLIKSLLNEKMYPKLTQLITQHMESAFFTGLIVQENKIKLGEIANRLCLIKSLINDQINTQSTHIFS